MRQVSFYLLLLALAFIPFPSSAKPNDHSDDFRIVNSYTSVKDNLIVNIYQNGLVGIYSKGSKNLILVYPSRKHSRYSNSILVTECSKEDIESDCVEFKDVK